MPRRAALVFAFVVTLVSARAGAAAAPPSGFERLVIDLGGSAESARFATGLGYTGTRPDPFDIAFLPPRTSPAFAWLASVVAGGENSRSFRLIRTDIASRPKRVLLAEKAAIVEIEIPGADADANGLAKFSPRIRVQADALSPRPTPTGPLLPSARVHLDPRYFRLKVDGLNVHGVASISAFTLTPGTGSASVTPVVVRIPVHHAESWLAWANDELVEGGAVTRRKVTLEYFSVVPTEKSKPILTVELVDAQLTAFEEPQWGDQMIAGSVSFTLKAKTARLK